MLKMTIVANALERVITIVQVFKNFRLTIILVVSVVKKVKMSVQNRKECYAQVQPSQDPSCNTFCVLFPNKRVVTN